MLTQEQVLTLGKSSCKEEFLINFKLHAPRKLCQEDSWLVIWQMTKRGNYRDAYDLCKTNKYFTIGWKFTQMTKNFHQGNYDEARRMNCFNDFYNQTLPLS